MTICIMFSISFVSFRVATLELQSTTPCQSTRGPIEAFLGLLQFLACSTCTLLSMTATEGNYQHDLTPYTAMLHICKKASTDSSVMWSLSSPPPPNVCPNPMSGLRAKCT